MTLGLSTAARSSATDAPTMPPVGMDDYSALAYRIAGSVADVRGCLILSRDGLILGSYPDDETAVKPAWMRFASLGDPERSFVEFGDQVWVYVRRPAYGAFAVADAGVRPGLVIDQLEQILLSAEEARARRETLRVPEAMSAPSGKPRTSLHPPADRPDAAPQPAPAAATPESRPWARADANLMKRSGGDEPGLTGIAELADVAEGVGPSGDGAADADPGSEAKEAAVAVASDNGKGGGKKEGKKAEKGSGNAGRAGSPEPAADTDAPTGAKVTERGGDDAVAVKTEDSPMELDADAEVDPVLLAKEFSGLLQVESGDDEATS
jgi:hypothetical protein